MDTVPLKLLTAPRVASLQVNITLYDFAAVIFGRALARK